MKLILAVTIIFTSQMAIAQNDPAFVQYLNPPGLSVPKGYSHAVAIDLGPVKMIIMSGQVALNQKGELIGAGNVGSQARQIFANIDSIVKAFGGNMRDIVKLNYYLLNVKDVQQVRDARDKFINVAQPPASTLVEVSKLFRNDLLIEIEATAIIKK